MHSPIGNKLSRNTVISLSGIVALVLVTVVTISVSQQQQQTQSQATGEVNLIKNPGCETTITGWGSWQGTASRTTSVARTGSASCVVVKGSTGSSYTLDDNPNTVSYPANGSIYTASAWVRTTNAVGKPVKIAIREYNGSNFTKTTYSAPVYLSTSWQLISHSATVTNGPSSVDVHIVQENASTGHILLVDDISLIKGVPQAPTPTPTPTKAPTPTPDAPTATPTPSTPSLTVNKTTAAAGEQITATWANIPTPTANDFIGLHTTSSTNSVYIGWIYVSCTQTPSTAKASGSCTFPLPDSMATGTYDLRFHTNNTTNVIVKSQSIAVTGASAPTATPTPTTIATAPTATKTPTPTPAAPTATPTPAVATATPAPGSTIAKVNLLLHGIGKGGDSANPDALGNANPLRKTRTVTVDVYNAQNQLAVTKQATVTFDSVSGSFKGDLNLGSDFASGVYTIRIKTAQYLRGLVSGIQTITTAQTTTLPNLTLIAGDVNNDNQINIIDYNLLTGCYSDLLPAIDCTEANKLLTDFNDDGKTNQFDYNLFLRELTNIGGQ